MNTLNFINIFSVQASCQSRFKDNRLKRGMISKKGRSKSHVWLKGKGHFESKEISFRAILNSSTVLEYSNVAILTLYSATLFITITEKVKSACETQRQLYHKRYKKVMTLLYKIFDQIGMRDNLCNLKVMIDLDEFFLKKGSTKQDRSKLNSGIGTLSLQNDRIPAKSFLLGILKLDRKYCKDLVTW